MVRQAHHKLSVVIVNWNTKELLCRCLHSLPSSISHHLSAIEIIVVDNASSDGSAKMVAEEFPQVKLIANSQNLGYAKANNQGIAISSGEFVMLLNPDTEFKPGSVERLVCFLEERPEAGAVAPKLIYPDGRLQHSCRTFPTLDVLVFGCLALDRLFARSKVFGKYKMSWWSYDEVREVEQPMASCLLLRRQALNEVGMMDEEFPIFFNDVDLCYRLKQAGWKIFFLPEAVVIHHHGASTRQVGPKIILESHRSLLRFYRKHYRKTMSLPLYGLACALIGVGGIIRCVAAHAAKILRQGSKA